MDNLNLKIEYIDVDKLTPYERNTRKHTDKDIDIIAKSIEKYGFNDAIGIWGKKNIVVEGHGRLLAAKKLGMDKVPCVRLDHLTEQERREYAIAHNRSAEMSEWDYDFLPEEYEELDFEGFDFGFDFDFGDEKDKEIIEDEPPEVDEENEPICKLGDIWQLGNHRLMCGDSTDREQVERLMNGEKADMVFTDPPYNMSDNLSGFISGKLKKSLDKIVDFNPETIKQSIEYINAGNYFIFTSKDLIPKYFEMFNGYGFNILVWCKDNPTPMTNNTFLPDIEYLLYFYNKKRIWNNGLDVSVYRKYYNSNKMQGQKELGSKEHPTVKPQQIIQDKIRICSNKSGIVLDLFGGSGSTLIACEQTDRNCYMMELDPKYVDVIIDRWEKFTGKKAVLLND